MYLDMCIIFTKSVVWLKTNVHEQILPLYYHCIFPIHSFKQTGPFCGKNNKEELNAR